MSILPKIDVPIFTEEVPSSKQKIKLRSMISKEEKILLMAKEANKQSAMTAAIKQVVNNCIVEPNFDINKLYAFDIEYLFLKLRSSSVSDKIIISVFDANDEQEHPVGIDLSKVVVKFPEKFEQLITVNKDIKIEMKYLSAQFFDDEELIEEQKAIKFIDLLLIKSIDKIYNGDSIIDAKTVSKKEMLEWLDDLPISTKDKMKEFLDNSPSLYYKAEYKNSLKEERYLELRSLNDFFMF